MNTFYRWGACSWMCSAMKIISPFTSAGTIYLATPHKFHKPWPCIFPPKNQTRTLEWPFRNLPQRVCCVNFKRTLSPILNMHEDEVPVCIQGRSQPHCPGWARLPLSTFFPQISINFLIFPQIFLISFLILVLRVGESPTREGPGYATVCIVSENILSYYRPKLFNLQPVRKFCATREVILHSY